MFGSADVGQRLHLKIYPVNKAVVKTGAMILISVAEIMDVEGYTKGMLNVKGQLQDWNRSRIVDSANGKLNRLLR